MINLRSFVSHLRFLQPGERVKRHLVSKRTIKWSHRAALRKVEELQGVDRNAAQEVLSKKLKSLASLKMILSDPRRGGVAKRRQQVDRYVEIVQRLVRERKKVRMLKKKKQISSSCRWKYVAKKQQEPGEQPPQEVVEEEVWEEKKEEESRIKGKKGPKVKVDEEEKEEESRTKGKKGPKVKVDKEEKEEESRIKGKKGPKVKVDEEEKEEESRIKGKKGPKVKVDKEEKEESRTKGKKGPKVKDKVDENKNSTDVMYVPPPEHVRRQIVLPEDVLETFRVELEAPPPTPLSLDPNLQIMPEIVTFKDFVCGRCYTKTAHLMNVGRRPVKCWLQELKHTDVIHISLPWSCFTLLTGLTMSLRIVFCPQQDTQGITRQVTLRTQRSGSPERGFLVDVRCEPSQAEPTVTPLDLTIPTGSTWGSVWVENKGSKSCTLNIRNLPLLDTGDLLEHILDNVFREFQFSERYNIQVGARERMRIRVKFSPHGAPGPREEKFLFCFQEAVPQEVTIHAVVSPNPVVVTPQALDLGLCLSDDHVIQQGFYVTNSSRTPVAVSAHAQHLTVIPSHALLQAGQTLRMCVRLITSLEGDLQLPVTVHAGQHSTVVKVHAVSCARSAISLLPQHIDLGIVTSAETVSCTVQLRNSTQTAHRFGFLDLPPGVSVQPGDGFGTILPRETLALQLLFSLEKSCSLVVRCHTQSGATATVQCVAHVIWSQCMFFPSFIIFPPTPCGSYSVVRAKLRALHDIKFQLKCSSEELIVMPCSGQLSRGEEETVLVLLRPEREESRAERITCITQTAWLHVPVTWSVTAPDFILREVSTCVEFGAVAMGTASTSVLHLHNNGQDSVSIVTSLLNPIGPFWCPLGPTQLGPGNILLLPFTFRPQVVDEFEQEYVEVRGNSTVLTVMLSGHGVTHKLTFHPDQLVYRLKGTSDTRSVQVRNLCSANLLISIQQVYACQGPAPKQDKNKKTKAKLEMMLESETQESMSPGESAFHVEPKEFTVVANQQAVFKVQYEARAANTMHVAKFNVSLGHSISLRDLTFVGISGALKKKNKKTFKH